MMLALMLTTSLTMMADNDRVINFEQLPAPAQALLKQSFGDKVVLIATADFDDYDWSVRYTDRVVAQLVNLVPSADIYFTSDHGESVYSGRWRDPSDEALWVVPEIVSTATNVVSAMRAENG